MFSEMVEEKLYTVLHNGISSIISKILLFVFMFSFIENPSADCILSRKSLRNNISVYDR